MRFELFLSKANSNNLGLPIREIKLLEYELLREQAQAYIDYMVVVRLRICKCALDTIVTPSEFAMVMERIDDIEDAFRGRDLTTQSLFTAKRKTALVLDLLKITLGNNPSTAN